LVSGILIKKYDNIRQVDNQETSCYL
jgi:hypothetical protein